MSESETYDIDEDSAHGEMTGNPRDISTEVDDLLETAETSQGSKAN